MATDREMEAFCARCDSVQAHVSSEPGSCVCGVCGTVQQMMSPLNEPAVA